MQNLKKKSRSRFFKPQASRSSLIQHDIVPYYFSYQKNLRVQKQKHIIIFSHKFIFILLTIFHKQTFSLWSLSIIVFLDYYYMYAQKGVVIKFTEKMYCLTVRIIRLLNLYKSLLILIFSKPNKLYIKLDIYFTRVKHT